MKSLHNFRGQALIGAMVAVVITSFVGAALSQ